MRARRPPFVIAIPVRIGVWRDDEALGAIGREDRRRAPGRVGRGRGCAAARAGRALRLGFCIGAGQAAVPQADRADREDRLGLSSPAAIAAATRRLTSSRGSFGYSALIPPWTNKVSADLDDGRIARGPSAEFARSGSRRACARPSRAASRPSTPDGSASGVICGSGGAVGGFDRRLVQLVEPSRRAADWSSAKAAYSPGRRVAIVAEQVHRLVVAEHDDRPCPPLRGASFCSCCRLRMILSESGPRSVMSPSWTSIVFPPAQ